MNIQSSLKLQHDPITGVLRVVALLLQRVFFRLDDSHVIDLQQCCFIFYLSARSLSSLHEAS